MKHYYGWRDEDGNTHVRMEDGKRDRPLPLRLDLDNHSPTGFEWGYTGSGPAQLALALLADALGDDGLAARLHQQFKRAYVAGLQREKHERWRISKDEVVEIVNAIERGEHS